MLGPQALVAQQLLPIAFLMVVGYLGIRWKAIPETSLDAFAKYITNIAIPVMILYRIPRTTDKEALLSAFPLLLFAFAMYAAMLLMGYIVGRLLGYRGERLRVNMTQNAIGNYVVIGIPVISATLGSEADVYLAIVMLVDQIYLYLVAFPLTLPAERSQKPDAETLKKLLNPMTLSLVAALMMTLVEFSFAEDGVIGRSLATITNSCQAISIIFLGGMLSTLHIKKGSGMAGALLTVLFKMLLMPLLVFSAAAMLPIPLVGCQVLAMVAALPSVLSVVLMTKANGTDSDYATVNVCVTTACYLFTFPLVIQIMGHMA